MTPDIALVKLTKPVKFDENIKPICLTKSDSEDLPKCSDFSLDEGLGRQTKFYFYEPFLSVLSSFKIKEAVQQLLVGEKDLMIKKLLFVKQTQQRKPLINWSKLKPFIF